MKFFKILLLLSIILQFFFNFYILADIKKPKIGFITYYCNNLNPQSLNCQEWKATLQQKFEVEEKIFRKIKTTKVKAKNVSTYCMSINPQEEACQSWRSLRQKYLELKGILLNEIKNFCKQNPQHPFCKSVK